MIIFGASIARPDKDYPMLLWFKSAQAARRSIFSALNFTAREYGAIWQNQSLITTGGYQKCLRWVHEATGETRINAAIKMLDVSEETIRELKMEINLAPVRITAWRRAPAGQFDYWLTAPRARSKTGVDRYYERRAEAAKQRKMIV